MSLCLQYLRQRRAKLKFVVLFHMYIMSIYTGCPRRNVRDFGRVFLMLNYTDITLNTCVQSKTVTEIMARVNCGRHRFQHTVRRPWRHTCPMRLPDQQDMLIQWPWRVRYSHLVTCEVQICLLFFSTCYIAICILCTDFVMAMHVLLFKNIKGVFPIEGFRLEVYLHEFTRHCVILVLFRVFLCSLKGWW